MEPKEHAERLINYFERSASENEGVEIWQKGVATAKEWLRLIEAECISASELSIFLNVVHANRYRSSAWHDLALGAYPWVSSKGIDVPSPDIFFAPDGLPKDDRLFGYSSLEHAIVLNDIFQEKTSEDPTTEGWQKGCKITEEWLRLIEKSEKKEVEILALVEQAQSNQRECLAMVWFDTVFTISLWCKSIGHLDLVPDNYQELVSQCPTLKENNAQKKQPNA